VGWRTPAIVPDHIGAMTRPPVTALRPGQDLGAAPRNGER